jgi:hypothetical protein
MQQMVRRSLKLAKADKLSKMLPSDIKTQRDFGGFYSGEVEPSGRAV